MSCLARERLAKMCADADVSFNVALGVLNDSLREFPPGGPPIKQLGGANLDRLSYARHLARHRGSENLERVVWDYLVD
ncbi:hypothetical protein [Limnoglobus roseus]|uniref:Uncharacterized protein n=1 Tax=Limnoglobus roseus TaxID=2598579 RepID=A0A5C1AMT5_9BACT|nr:hypothetical protein [Limnoglobus roseus]QEL18514.1 hypothetical protein PX52LOC_05540 [Limnoglobus roseus]